jgi:CMP-N-acetylneuraminic acid synthetase
MLKDKRILVVVPARGGSKGIPKKNLYPVFGKPLIAYTGELAGGLPCVDRAVVSTDSPEIARAAEACGLAAPFMRSPELSGDTIGDIDVLREALVETERADSVQYDVVAMLQPTSPLRRPAHVTAVLAKLISEAWDAVWTVSRTDLKYHPLKQLAVDGNGRMSYFDPRGSAITARQQLGPVYYRNGAAYALTRACILEQGTMMGARSAAVVVEEPLISIDTVEDVRAVEELLRARGSIPGAKVVSPHA